MPIFKFLAVAGSILVALLFVADATLAPRGPLFTNNSEGLPRSEPMRAQPKVPERSRVLARVEPPRTVAPTVTAAPPLAEAPVPPVAKTAIATPAAPEAVAAAAP